MAPSSLSEEITVNGDHDASPHHANHSQQTHASNGILKLGKRSEIRVDGDLSHLPDFSALYSSTVKAKVWAVASKALSMVRCEAHVQQTCDLTVDM